MPSVLRASATVVVAAFTVLLAVAAALVALTGDTRAAATVSPRTSPLTRPQADAGGSGHHSPAVQGRPAPHRPSRSSRRHAIRTYHGHERWFRPARGPVTSWYGGRWGGFHPGIDIGARYGSPVRAITAGKVISAGWITGYGKVIRIRAHGMVFYYPHLSRIRVGHGHVRGDQLIGRVGSTGFSTGPHVHVEIRRHDHSFNPRRILARHGVHL